MKKLMGAAMLAGATIAGVGAANAGEVSGNISLTSDYIFRGVSLSDNGPAIQGGFDMAGDMFYAGIWGSSLSSGMELDLYAGFTPTTGPVEWDIGAIGYFYPGADDDGAEFDYYELMAAATTALSEQVSVGASVYWSPENYGDTGDALYLEINGGFAVSDTVSFSAAYGNQSIDDADGPLPGVTQESDYNTWNLGGTFAMHGFEIDLRYHDTDIEAGSDIEAYTFGEASYDSAFVVTFGRAL